MNESPRLISLEEWDALYVRYKEAGMVESAYGGPLSRHVAAGDLRLRKLKFDNSPAALGIWNFLLTEEDRLEAARQSGRKLVGAMKDLGTVPVMAYSSLALVAFYPDGAWWIPCVMELSEGLMGVADRLGVDESFCPVRAMLGAFETKAHFPLPDLLICSVGAVCDDFSAIAQRLNGMGYPILWWEIPHCRRADDDEAAAMLPDGRRVPRSLVEFTAQELDRVRQELGRLAGRAITDDDLREGIKQANRIRRVLDELRAVAYRSSPCPMGGLEMLIAEMLALHFCSDRDEAFDRLKDLLAEVKRRVVLGQGVLSSDAVPVFWINPVADLRMMNLLEDAGGRICGTEYLFLHALDLIPEDSPPLEALALMALSDPMVGSSSDRARRIVSEIRRFGARAVVLSRIPGASHCALEGQVIADMIRDETRLPVVEVEVPPVLDAMEPTLRTRLEGLIETARGRESSN